LFRNAGVFGKPEFITRETAGGRIPQGEKETMSNKEQESTAKPAEVLFAEPVYRRGFDHGRAGDTFAQYEYELFSCDFYRYHVGYRDGSELRKAECKRQSRTEIITEDFVTGLGVSFGPPASAEKIRREKAIAEAARMVSPDADASEFKKAADEKRAYDAGCVDADLGKMPATFIGPEALRTAYLRGYRDTIRVRQEGEAIAAGLAAEHREFTAASEGRILQYNAGRRDAELASRGINIESQADPDYKRGYEEKAAELVKALWKDAEVIPTSGYAYEAGCYDANMGNPPPNDIGPEAVRASYLQGYRDTTLLDGFIAKAKVEAESRPVTEDERSEIDVFSNKVQRAEERIKDILDNLQEELPDGLGIGEIVLKDGTATLTLHVHG
jgi:hypothetical protein